MKRPVLIMVPPSTGGGRGRGQILSEAGFTVSKARYAKRSVAVRAPGVNGWKSRAARLAEALKGRYSNREGAYIMSEAKARRLRTLYDEGWDASTITGELEAPREGVNYGS